MSEETPRRGNARPARRQRGDGPRHGQPDHAGMGELLPGAASSRAYASLDRYMWQLTYKWACHRHSHKPKTWITSRYFGRYNKSRQDRWVFGDRDSGAYMPKLAWTKIVRHPLVRGRASPDDPAQASYWAERRRKKQATARPQHPPPAPQAKRPLPAMRRPAPARRPRTTKPARMGTVAPTTRKAITRHIVSRRRDGPPDGTRLMHSHCQRRATGARREPAPLYT